MHAAQSFQDVVAWQRAHAFVLDVYRQTRQFPREEVYGLTSQLRRAAISIPANIAEGFSRRGVGDKLRFLNIAQASLEESRYYLILARDLDYLSDEDLMASLESVGRLLAAYVQGIQRNHVS